MMSSNITSIFLKILLKNFYRILAPKFQKTLELDDKLKIVIGLDAIRNSENQNQIMEKFVRQAEVILLKGQLTSSEEFYKMVKL